MGRFLNADEPILLGANGGIMGYNMFAYCNNNPVMYIDPSGMCAFGDMYWTIEFGPHTLFAGDVCPVCHKIVDNVYMADPWGWTELQRAHPDWTGAEVSEALACKKTVENAYQVAKTTGRSIQEKEAIFQKELAKAVCFVAGTPIKTDRGDIAIEEIQVGEYVWAHNPETGETELRQVVRTFENQTTELIIVHIGDELIETTPEHPFYVPNCNEPRAKTTGLGSGWVKAKDLRSGDELLLLDGQTIKIQSIDMKFLEEPIKVYNFEVEGFHTYFVSDVGLLVHNICFAKDGIYDTQVRYESNHPPHAHIRKNHKQIATVSPYGEILAGELDRRGREYLGKYLTLILDGIQRYYKG